MDEKVVKRTLLFGLFACLVFFSFLSINSKISLSGGSVFSSRDFCTNLGGTCSLTCSDGYHSIGTQDCRIGAGSAGSGGGSISGSLSAPDGECGDGQCEVSEATPSSPYYCEFDCGAPRGGTPPNGFCGDDECELTESIPSSEYFCEYDCQAICGDGYCYGDENVFTCENDCSAPTCGDEICEVGEGSTYNGDARYYCPGDCYEDDGDDGGVGGSSPILAKGVSQEVAAFVVYPVTGQVAYAPVCCVPNECYSNSDCSANKYCENYECVPNVNRILTSEEAITLSQTVLKNSCVREGDRINYNYDENGLTYTFIMKRVLPDKDRIDIEFRAKTYYLFESESANFDLTEDRVEDVQFLVSEINQENCVDVYISKLEKPVLSPDVAFFGTNVPNISPNDVGFGAFVLLASLVLIAESIKIIKKSKKSRKR